jgi:hypothetical protein
VPNNDGTIERIEVPLQAGLSAKFRVATNATIDTAGTPQPDGSRVWDLTAALSGDHAVVVETKDIAGQWFAADFQGATYTSKLSESSDLLGVFAITGSALELRGVVSPAGGNTKTELNYNPAVSVLSFPLKEGGTFMTNSLVSGTASGFPSGYSEIYQSTVDAHGKLKTPFADFNVLRVGTLLTRTAAGVVTTTRTYAFVTECFGTVATIQSQYDELQTEFTSAAEVRRLAP